MTGQGEMPAKLSKSQKKKKTAQKKKLALRNEKADEERRAVEKAERMQDEIDARIVEQLHDKAMRTRDFQMLNIRGRLLAHPSQSFLEAVSDLRQSMGRDIYPHRINHAQRLYHFGVNNIPLPSWSVAMGTASYFPLSRLHLEPREESVESPQSNDNGGKVAMFRLAEPVRHERRGAFTDQSNGALGLMIWYPIISKCMSAGDKLACIALRDTCVLLRTCYGLFRNDTTRLEQFVFDAGNSNSVKQLDWVARRVEVPPSPPQTPPRGSHANTSSTEAGSLLDKDRFTPPIVVKKRWADYEDDESLGSPMSLPITPESSSDVPALDLEGPTNESNGGRARAKETMRRAPTVVLAIPTLTASAPWFSTTKTVLPVSRISVFTSEDFPRSYRTSSLHPMRLQSTSSKHVPCLTSSTRDRARLEHWVRDDVEKNLKKKLALSGTAKKKAEAEAEILIYNRMAALAGINTGETVYIGEPDIMGAGIGISVDDVRDMVTGRFKTSEDDSIIWSEHSIRDPKTVRVMLVSSTEGWICRHLGDLQP